jgi:hypothetical protein
MTIAYSKTWTDRAVRDKTGGALSGYDLVSLGGGRALPERRARRAI